MRFLAGLIIGMCLPGVIMTFTNVGMRYFDMQYSHDLTHWNWWGTMNTTSAVAGLALEERVTNGAGFVKFWRVIEKTN